MALLFLMWQSSFPKYSSQRITLVKVLVVFITLYQDLQIHSCRKSRTRTRFNRFFISNNSNYLANQISLCCVILILIHNYKRMKVLHKTCQQMYKSHKQITNVYVHLPFCKNKCHFCAFPVHAVGSQPNQPLMEQYIHQLTTEIQISKKYLNLNSPISSLYFGGGTPSLQSPTQVQQLINMFPINYQTEITLQMNPSQLQMLPSFLSNGCNRISLGIQTFNNKLLGQLNRYNAANYNRNKMQQQIMKSRPANLSVDFILNFCLQQDDWAQILSFLKQVKPQHITLYILQINEGSNIYSRPDQYKWLPKQQPVVNRYVQACQQLSSMGYNHYEVSNFALSPQFKSQHSSVYWQGDSQFLAYGMGASSLLKGVRATRPKTLSKYYKYVSNLKNGLDINLAQLDMEIHEQIEQRQKLQSVLMSRLRLKEGISWAKINQIDSRIQVDHSLMKTLKQIQHQRAGLIDWQVASQRISLTSPWGFLLADQIICKLVTAIP